MVENDQLSDKTKNDQTSSSASQSVLQPAKIGQHDNAIVPHQISNHDKLVQTMVMVDGEWINVNDTNDQKNLKEDLHKVNKVVTEAQKGIVEAKNSAESAVKYADLAVSASKVNSDAIVAQSSAISEAKAAADDAASKAQAIRENATSEIAAIRNSVGNLQSVVTTSQQKTDEMLLQKADKALVDQSNNKLSQLSAQQKIMADQIDSKVSSAEYKTLDNKVDSAVLSINKNSTAIDENSKVIKLKADSTEVNNLKGTVNSHSASINLFSNQLKSMVTESKVNDMINSNGFATQSFTQSIVNQKAGQLNESITQLDSKVNSSGGGVNLVSGTAEDIVVDDTANTGTQGWCFRVFPLNTELKIGDKITVSADVTLTGKGNLSQWGMSLWSKDVVDMRSNEYSADVGKGSTVTLTVTSISDISKPTALLIYCGRIGDTEGKKAVFHHLKVERGEIATPYSPAPSDNATVTQLQSVTASIDGLQSNVTNYQKDTTSKYTQLSNLMQSKVGTADFEQLKRSVDMQTLDSADINNMKMNGHYFVRNLANNPIGGWVYVDVTGDGSGRIRQDVYQDSGTKHSFRRWFGTHWTGWSTGAEESEITQLRSDINLRVKSGDLLSQINIAAGRTLIQSNKIYFDADSFVLGPQAKAFISSAYITDINADKITTGTLDAAKFHVKNFTADNISGGTLKGVIVKTGDNNQFFQTSKNNIYWIRDGSKSLIGKDIYLSTNNGLSIADEDSIQITTWGGAIVNSDGSITNNAGNWGHPRIIVNSEGGWDADGQYFGNKTGNPEIFQWVGSKEYTSLLRGKGFTFHLDDGNKKSIFAVQKDNKIGFYVGTGDDGNDIQIAGFGAIKTQHYIDDGFNDGMTHTLGNLQVDNLHVRKWLGVDSNKNAVVKTSQGTVAINAYETAEYYFGDLGEAQTGSNGIAYIGIEKLFNETVNTAVPYQVFLTAYGPGNIWVDQRMSDRFVVKSDQPNIKFGWEIKAKRKGYEHTRLKNVDDKLNHMEATS